MTMAPSLNGDLTQCRSLKLSRGERLAVSCWLLGSSEDRINEVKKMFGALHRKLTANG